MGGTATGIAFDGQGNLRRRPDGDHLENQLGPPDFVFATLEPSVAAFHLAFGPKGSLFVAGPTTSSFEPCLINCPQGEVKVFYRGLGRPQRLDASGNLQWPPPWEAIAAWPF